MIKKDTSFFREVGVEYLTNYGCNVVAIGKNKRPTHEYTNPPNNFKARAQTVDEVQTLKTKNGHDAWQHATGVGVICGVGGWLCIDIDAIKSKDADPEEDRVPDVVVDTLCNSLGLDFNTYEWVVESGSGLGWHVWLRCMDTGDTTTGVERYKPLPKFAGAFDHLELRLSDCYTIVPPSNHASGSVYGFSNLDHKAPHVPPFVFDIATIRAAVETVCVVPDPTPTPDTTTNRATVARIEDNPDTSNGGGYYNPTTGEVLSSTQDLKYAEEQAKEEARRRFDLVEYIKRHLNTTHTERVPGSNEIRIGKHGDGYGGWFVDGQIWNTFREGKGDIGGDCFTLVLYTTYGITKIKRDAQKWRNVLEIVARETGVTFPTYATNGNAVGGGLVPYTGTGGTDLETDGVTVKKNKTPAVVLVTEYLKPKFDFRWNTVRNRVEWRLKDGESWGDLRDLDIDNWVAEVERTIKQYVAPTRFLGYVRTMATMYDPFREYFDNLPTHDGTDHIADFIDTIETPLPDRERFREDLEKWLVGVYTCAYFGATYGNRNELFLVLTGKQSAGKTTVLRKLVPDQLKKYEHCGTVDESKDSEILLSESFISINDELTTLGKVSREHLKALLSKEFFRFRAPYGRITEDHTRRVSFCGATNETTFLADHTGNRRFLVHVVHRVDFDRLAAINIHGLWSQVIQLKNAGKRHYLTDAEVNENMERNKAFETQTDEEAFLLKYFRPAEEADPAAEHLTPTDIATRIKQLFADENTIVVNKGMQGDTPQRNGVPTPALNVVKMGQALTKLKYDRTSKRHGKGGVWGYWVALKNATDEGSQYAF